MPLIQNLKNPAIRERHWDQLHKEINKDFDPHGDDFTLEKVFTLGLHLHSEFVGTMSSNANKELAIETALGEIAEAWRGIDIELAPFKEVYVKKALVCTLYITLCTPALPYLTPMYTRYTCIYTICTPNTPNTPLNTSKHPIYALYTP